LAVELSRQKQDVEAFKYLWENQSHLWTAQDFLEAILLAQRYLDTHSGGDSSAAFDALEDLMLFLMRSKTSHGLFLVLSQP